MIMTNEENYLYDLNKKLTDLKIIRSSDLKVSKKVQ